LTPSQAEQPKVLLKPRAASWLASLDADSDREAAKSTLRDIPAAFGRPHAHAGLGLRQLRPGIFECRIGLRQRAIFVREGSAIVVVMIGTHNEVRAYLKENT
jgi:hypothetical protein